MSVVHFQCPSCQAPLRLQNRALFVGRTFDCPDCRESLLIEAEGSTGVTAKRQHKLTRSASEGREVNTPSLALRVSLDGRSRVTDHGMDLQSPTSIWGRLIRRPAALGWIVASLLAVILLIVVNSGREPSKSEFVSPVAADAQSTESASDDHASPLRAEEQNSEATAKPDPIIPEADATKAVAKLELPPLPEPVAVVEPPRDDKPAPVAEKPPTEEPKPVVPPPPATLSAEAVETKLRQKIARFDQVKPTPFVKLLETIEELAGVPIVWDLERVDDEQLQKPVTLQLKQTTVGEILDTLLQQVSLERRTVEGKIELRPTMPNE